MKQINITLYRFDELSPEVQKEIIERERWNIMEFQTDCTANDYRNSLKEFENIFDVNCHDSSVDYCGYEYSFKLTKDEAYEWSGLNGWDCIELENLSGKLLVRYLQNNILPHIQKGKYYGRLLGQQPNMRLIKRYSKVIKEINCPLTGCGTDMDLLNPVIEYLKNTDNSTTYRELMKRCLNNFFKAWHEEYEYWGDNEDALREELQYGSGYEDTLYHANGKEYTGPLKDIA